MLIRLGGSMLFHGGQNVTELRVIYIVSLDYLLAQGSKQITDFLKSSKPESLLTSATNSYDLETDYVNLRLMGTVT